MVLNIGQVVGEFRESNEPEGGYTRKLKRLMLIKGRLPQNGAWEVVVLTDTGFTDCINENDLEANDGRYVVGGSDIIMHEAGLDGDPIEVKLNSVRFASDRISSLEYATAAYGEMLKKEAKHDDKKE